jgi:hypothetical protein
VCIAEREEHTEEQLSALTRYIIAHEQEIWNDIIGPVIDRIADLWDDGMTPEERAETGAQIGERPEDVSRKFTR